MAFDVGTGAHLAESFFDKAVVFGFVAALPSEGELDLDIIFGGHPHGGFFGGFEFFSEGGGEEFGDADGFAGFGGGGVFGDAAEVVADALVELAEEVG